MHRIVYAAQTRAAAVGDARSACPAMRQSTQSRDPPMDHNYELLFAGQFFRGSFLVWDEWPGRFANFSADEARAETSNNVLQTPGTSHRRDDCRGQAASSILPGTGRRLDVAR